MSISTTARPAYVYNSAGSEWVRISSPVSNNLLYNGAMQVSQRGTSTTGITGSGYYTADRWSSVGPVTAGTWTQDIQTDAPTGSGFRRSLRMLCTTANNSLSAGSYLIVSQILEGQDLQRIRKGTSSAQKLTLSFWVKSNVTGTYVIELADADNTRIACASYSVSASATWERKTITFPADTTGAFDNDNASSLQLAFWLVAGSTFTSGTLQTTWAANNNANRAVGQTNLASAINNYWQITGVQLETGDVATDFEFKSYGQELRECQRYYYLHVSGVNKAIGIGAATIATEVITAIQFPVTMRATPSLVASSGTDYYRFYRNSGNDTFNSFTAYRGHENGMAPFNSSEISSTVGQAGLVDTFNAAASVAFNAEL